MGRAIQAAEQETANEPILLHLNGPCGDIDPILMGDDKSLDTMTGRLLMAFTKCRMEKRRRLTETDAFAGVSRYVSSVAPRDAARCGSGERAASSVQSFRKAAGVRHHSGAGYEAFLLAEEHIVSMLPDAVRHSLSISALGRSCSGRHRRRESSLISDSHCARFGRSF